jgi:hypothetical protein
MNSIIEFLEGGLSVNGQQFVDLTIDQREEF